MNSRKICLEGMPGCGKTSCARIMSHKARVKVVSESYISWHTRQPPFVFIKSVLYLIIDVCRYAKLRFNIHDNVLFDRSYISTLAFSYAYTKTYKTYSQRYHSILVLVVRTLTRTNLLPIYDHLISMTCDVQTSIQRRSENYSPQYHLWFEPSFLNEMLVFYNSHNLSIYCRVYTRVETSNRNLEDIVKQIQKEIAT